MRMLQSVLDMRSEKMNWKILFLIVAAFLFSSAPVLSETEPNLAELIPIDSSNFFEKISTTPDVSGTPVVGFKIGKTTDKIDSDKIYVTIPSSVPPLICVEGRTKDARFSSRNRYTINKLSQNQGVAVIKPFVKETKSGLEKYPLDQFALRAYQTSDGECMIQNALYLPQILSLKPIPNSLHLLINAGSRTVSANLVFFGNGKKPIKIEGRCQCVDNTASLTFNTVCSFEPFEAHFPTEGDVTVLLDDGFGEDKIIVKVLLPKNVL
jgi:hypothetical protein